MTVISCMLKSHQTWAASERHMTFFMVGGEFGWSKLEAAGLVVDFSAPHTFIGMPRPSRSSVRLPGDGGDVLKPPWVRNV